ncbi:hypothetical protein BDCR2A_01407 [Borrelia duttonii CR2A]|uniref:Uncharacterized protein n=1 Tax=Borrelia duttonii CR2A TaxID=1432657 RepID=W6TGZ0_9SPIR|nr:hypothetical protein [Borrelia duttonii]ETZ17663.1 hypothetical protein BDCR2A_01407 [Borrelia duttonii CR2A]
MKIIGKTNLYKIGEVVEILKANFNYQKSKSHMCRKASLLNAYITYNNMRFIPECIIGELMTDITIKDLKSQTKANIAKKLAITKKEIQIYDNNIEISNTNDINEIIHETTMQLKQEITQLKQEIIQLKQTIKKQIFTHTK